MPAVHVGLRSRNLLERILYATLFVAVLALGFFFLVAALIAGAVLVVVLLARFWWWKRKFVKAANEEFITTEYTVVERERLDQAPANPDERRLSQDPEK